MSNRCVECVEVVVGGLDLRALGDTESQADEHVLDPAPGLGDEMKRPQLRPRVGGQGDVHPVPLQTGLELGGGQLLVPALDRLLERLAGLVGRLAHGCPLLGWQLGHRAQQVRQLRLAAQVGDARLLQVLAVPGRRDRLLGLGPDLGDLLDLLAHQPAILFASSYSATVAAIAALSELVAMGIWATWSATATTSCGSPSRSAPISRVAWDIFRSYDGRSPNASPSPGTKAIFVPGSPPTSPAVASGTSNTAPMLARTAFKLNGSAVVGPSATHEAPNAAALR